MQEWKPKIAVAIVTARSTGQTSWPLWVRIRGEYLSGRRSDPLFDARFGALIAASCATPAEHHVVHQLRCLALQTREPDEVLALHHDAHPGREGWTRWESIEGLGSVHWVSQNSPVTVSMGCHDKNRAMSYWPDIDALIMLDDCMLADFALVEAVDDWLRNSEQCSVLMLGHRKFIQEEPRLERAEANWLDTCRLTPAEASRTRRVFGIWAMRPEVIRALGGYNELLDGSRHGLDEEFMIRCDRYLEHHGGHYYYDRRARVYEIGHDMPWASPSEDTDWRRHLPEVGWKSPKGIS